MTPYSCLAWCDGPGESWLCRNICCLSKTLRRIRLRLMLKSEFVRLDRMANMCESRASHISKWSATESNRTQTRCSRYRISMSCVCVRWCWFVHDAEERMMTSKGRVWLCGQAEKRDIRHMRKKCRKFSKIVRNVKFRTTFRARTQQQLLIFTLQPSKNVLTYKYKNNSHPYCIQNRLIVYSSENEWLVFTRRWNTQTLQRNYANGNNQEIDAFKNQIEQRKFPRMYEW